MALQDRLDAFKADFETNKAPASVVAIMRKSTADLISVGPSRPSAEGGRRSLPLSNCPTRMGNLVRSADLLARGPPGPDLLSWGLVPLLQHGPAGDRGRV